MRFFGISPANAGLRTANVSTFRWLITTLLFGSLNFRVMCVVPISTYSFLMNSFGRFSRFVLLSVLFCAFAVVSHAQSFVNFEGKQVSPIRASPDGLRLFAVNTPDARLSVF